MIIIYTGTILFILTLAVIISKNALTRSFSAYLISSCIVLISLLIYNTIISINYSIPTGFLERLGYYIVLNLKLHVADVVVLYNFGNLLLLLSSVFFLIASDKKNIRKKALLIIPAIIYFVLNHPRIKYKLWIYCISNNLDNPFELLVVLNSFLLLVYFILPIAQIISLYFKTGIFSKKKHLLHTAAYILFLEILMALILFTNPYSNYYPLCYDVNSNPLNGRAVPGILNNLFSVNSKIPELFLALALIILVYIIFCDVSSAFSLRIKYRKREVERENNEMIKTIFHTYKNAFFAIERFSQLVENAVDKENKLATEALNNIKSISHSSFINSKKMIDSVVLTYDFSQEKICIDLVEFLDEILLQFTAIPDLKIEKFFPDEKVQISASAGTLNEAFTNIINNAVEATAECENPIIKISLFTEDNSAIVNFYDNGCGIRKSNIKHIFKPLYSFKQSTYNLGIGLSTALKTINYHSGEICCKSKLDEYTIFQVVLPLTK